MPQVFVHTCCGVVVVWWCGCIEKRSRWMEECLGVVGLTKRVHASQISRLWNDRLEMGERADCIALSYSRVQY